MEDQPTISSDPLEEGALSPDASLEVPLAGRFSGRDGRLWQRKWQVILANVARKAFLGATPDQAQPGLARKNSQNHQNERNPTLEGKTNEKPLIPVECHSARRAADLVAGYLPGRTKQLSQHHMIRIHRCSSLGEEAIGRHFGSTGHLKRSCPSVHLFGYCICPSASCDPASRPSARNTSALRFQI